MIRAKVVELMREMKMNFDEMRPKKFEDLDDSLKEIINEFRKATDDEKDMQKYGSTSEFNEGNLPVLFECPTDFIGKTPPIVDMGDFGFTALPKESPIALAWG